MRGASIIRWRGWWASGAFRFRGSRTGPVSAPVDLSAVLADADRGVFGVEVKDGDGRRYDSRIVVWTNIGGTAHWQEDRLALFAHDLYSLDPLPGARVTVWSHKNQSLGTGITNTAGVFYLDDWDGSLGMPLGWRRSKRADDFSFVELRTRASVPEAFASTVSPFEAAAYDAFIYAGSECGIAPGRRRIFAGWCGRITAMRLAEVPLLFRVKDERGREVHSEAVVLSAYGTGTADLDTEASFATGTYRAELLVPGSTRPLQTHAIQVEDFVPNKLEAEATLAKAVWTSGEQNSLEVVAENLFGGAASDRDVHGNAVVRKGEFTSERWAGFRFGNDAKFLPVVRPLGKEKTDDDGRARFDLRFRSTLRGTAPLHVWARGRVF